MQVHQWGTENRERMHETLRLYELTERQHDIFKSVAACTEFYEYVESNHLMTHGSMTDEGGHQLPNITY